MAIQLDDPELRSHIEKELEKLSAEFSGTFSREAIERYVWESLEHMRGARFQDFIRANRVSFALVAIITR